MSRNALRFFSCPKLVPILQSIIAPQGKGVRERKRLMRRLYKNEECQAGGNAARLAFLYGSPFHNRVSTA